MEQDTSPFAPDIPIGEPQGVSRAQRLRQFDRALLKAGITSLWFRDPDTGEMWEEPIVDPDAPVDVFNIFTDAYYQQE